MKYIFLLKINAAKMLVKDVITNNPVCCIPETKLVEAAKLMLKNDCGAIPVVDNKKVCGIITDRDIVVRCLALGKNPMDCKVSDCMTSNIVTINKNSDFEECLKKMEDNQVRRMIKVCGYLRIEGKQVLTCFPSIHFSGLLLKRI